MQLYVQKLATCLLDEPQGSAAPLDLLRWTAEVSSLVRIQSVITYA